MATHFARGPVRAAALALVGVAALATVACASATSAASVTSAASATSAASTGGHRAAAATAVPFLLQCGGMAQIRPGSYVLPCAGGVPYLENLHWAAWGSSSALASGAYAANGGPFPALVVLWDAQLRPGHAGERYFTELTIIYTGDRSYTADGKKYQLPQTLTFPLSSFGGA